MIRWLQRWWWARQRAMDLAVLWPSCLQMAPNLKAARKAFFVHAVNDRAWVEHINEIGWAKAWEELKP